MDLRSVLFFFSSLYKNFKMRCEVVPSEFCNLVPFSSSSYSSYYPQNCENTFGVISKNGLWLYLVHGTVIDIYCTESGKWCGGYCFQQSLNNPSAKITAAVEFNSSHISFPALLLVVNQDDESLVCLFDVNSCKVERAVLIPDKVTSIDVVSKNGGVCIETHNLSRRLRFMFGIVAVGTLHGHIFFLDLCLDEDFSCNENSPNITAVIKQQDFSAERRETAIYKKQHVLLHLNVESSSGGSFEFKSPSSVLGQYPNGRVHVTAVKYIPSLSTLAVGFNFGGIQLWELHHLTLQFTIANDHEEAIVNFAFQEPENDPRNFCYLWVFKGHSVIEEDLPTSVSVATLYSLTYFKREFIEAFGALYSELQVCSKRFEFPLLSDTYSSKTPGIIGSRLMSCQIISQKDAHHTLDVVSANESDSVSEDMSLCFLSWEVWPNSERFPPSYHLAVFDLNQWYQAHMPATFRCHLNELSPYLGIFSLKEPARIFNKDDILGLYAIPQSIKKFKSLLVSEEFFYPSSLTFQQICFSERGICKTAYFGFQRHLLFELAELGPQALLNPKDVYPALIKSGLIADTHGGTEHTPLIVQKESLLQLALEYHLPYFFIKCLKEWRYAESIHECCTSKSLLKWAWKKVIYIKNCIDKFTIPLFNCSGDDVDKSCLKHLYSFRRQLNLVDVVMAGFEKHVAPRTEQGLQELQCRRDAISVINIYLQVLLWLRSVHVLPEICEEEATAKNIVYRLNNINDSFYLRRERLKKLHSSLASTDVFLIDGLVNEAGVSSFWQEKNGNSTYPPPSIYAAISSYLVEGVSLEVKHMLMYYLLLDLQDMNAGSSFSAELKKFPQIFSLPKSKMKLVKSFWYLDRRDTKNAIKKLLDSAVRVSDISPWQHQRIIKSFLFWKAPQEALKYINHMEPPQVTVDDMKLHLSVLLACGAITQAYEYQRKLQQVHGNELLSHLFLSCQELRKMKDLMYLPLNSLESWALVKFLSESEDPRAQESLVIYHLLHCNFFDAARVNEKLSRLLMNKIALIYGKNIHERSIDREALVESLMAAVSSTERCLLEEIDRLPPDAFKKEETTEPLSASIKCIAGKEMTYSDILRALLVRTSVSDSDIGGSPHVNTRKSYFESMPFLRPPVTPECVRKPASVQSSKIVSKRSLMQISPEYSTPAKRSRLLDNAPFKSSPLLKRTPKTLAGDIVSLLQTPPIHRRASTLLKSKDNQSTPTITPQSILKKKHEVKKVQLDFRAPTPPLCSEDENSEDEVMQIDKNLESKDSTSSENYRQIRFELPVENKLIKEENNAKPAETSALHSSLKNTITPRELGDNSFGSLTREPIRSIKKRISFHDEVQKPEIDMEVEVLDVSEKEIKSILHQKQSSLRQTQILSTSCEKSLDVSEKEIKSTLHQKQSSIQVQRFSTSLHKDEILFPSSSFISDIKTASSTKPASPLKGISDAGSSECKSSEAVDEEEEDDDVEILMEVQGPSHSFQRSSVTPRLPLRCNFPKSREEEEIFLEGFESGSQGSERNISFAATEDIFPYQSAVSPDCLIVEQTVAEESENEIFYSPCSDHASFTPAPYAISEPVALFHENIEYFPTEEENVFNIENVPNKKDADEINKPISFAFAVDHSSESSSNSTLSSAGSSSKDVVEVASENLKSPLDTSRVTEAVLSEKTSDAKSLSEEEKCSEMKCEVELESQTAGINAIAPKHKFTFSRFSKTTSETDTTVEQSSIQVDATEDTKSKTILKPEVTVESKTVPKHRFTFSFSQTPKNDNVVLDEKNCKMDITDRSECKIALDTSSAVKNTATKHTFTFTKPESSKTSIEVKNSEMDIIESNKCEETQALLSSNVAPKHVFTFSKPLTLTTAAELKNMTQQNSSTIFATSSNFVPKHKFTFSKPLTVLEECKIPSVESISKIDTTSESLQSKIEHKTESSQFPTATDESKGQQDSKCKTDHSSNKTKFLLTNTAGTYEEFSDSLKKNTSNVESSQQDNQKTLLSSPCAVENKEFKIQETPTSKASDKSKKKTTTKKKISSKEKMDKSIKATPVSSRKKKGSKGKISEKIEFTFAEPTSPATPEILEVLAKSPEPNLPSFLFSPPLTRGRLRQKRLDETMGSSFCSMASDMSFMSRPPPMDSILESSIQEKTTPKRTSKTSAKKKTSSRKDKSQSNPDMSSILEESKLQTSSKKSPPPSPKNTSVRHSMILRQTKPK
ncbi:protein ELYS [Caerostris darwini]|uniref:Protein ELYS n=1 Tax=Caerostris darwini TaxID=1538125 RepID=A0AAV4VAP6_9ARAC|nr:protein ELYS [Caerostris darwini]